MFTLSVIAALIIVCAIWFHFAAIDQKNREIKRVSSELAAWQDSALQWETYANYLVTLCNSKDIDLYFARADYEVSRDPQRYSIGNDKRVYAQTLPLMPVANHGSRINTDSDGRFIFTLPDPVATVESSAASEDQKTESTGKAQKTSKAKDQKTQKTESAKVQKTESSAASAKDNGSFAASDNSKLLKTAKFREFLTEVNKVIKRKLTESESQYCEMKFLYWETEKTPSPAKEYAKRVTGNNFGSN